MLQDILTYYLKVVTCSGLLLLYYSIALRNKRFHQYNRFYLLITVLLSTTLPLLHLEWFALSSSSAQKIHLFNIISLDENEEINLVGGSSLNWPPQALIYAIVSTGLIMMLGLISRIIRIFRLKKKFPVKNMAMFDFVITDLHHAPFTFFKNIFWRKDIDLHEETGRQVLQHEITHIRQRHSWDKIFMQSILCFYWMNPFFWWLKKELYVIHEFTADEKAVENNDATSFAKMLLTTQYGKFDFSPAQSFFYSPVKRRLIMLTISKRPSFSYLRRLLILPLISAVVCLFAFTVKNESLSPEQTTIAKRPFVLVVDAGHGGKDFGAVNNGLHEKDITLKIAQAIKKLSPEYGIDVILTRNSDVFMSPTEKSNFANAQHADAFISVHVNADSGSQEQSGLDVVLSKNNAQAFSSILLGSAIVQSLQPEFQIKPALLQKTAGITVLDKSVIPAALIECGYLTNSTDAKMLQDDSKIELMARQILSGTGMYANDKNSIAQDSFHITRVGENNKPIVEIIKVSASAKTPLYVLDGKIITKGQSDKLDPSSIERMNVLKGKDATDKYGDKGKNGVVEITLKKNP